MRSTAGIVDDKDVVDNVVLVGAVGGCKEN